MNDFIPYRFVKLRGTVKERELQNEKYLPIVRLEFTTFRLLYWVLYPTSSWNNFDCKHL